MYNRAYEPTYVPDSDNSYAGKNVYPKLDIHSNRFTIVSLPRGAFRNMVETPEPYLEEISKWVGTSWLECHTLEWLLYILNIGRETPKPAAYLPRISNPSSNFLTDLQDAISLYSVSGWVNFRPELEALPVKVSVSDLYQNLPQS